MPAEPMTSFALQSAWRLRLAENDADLHSPARLHQLQTARDIQEQLLPDRLPAVPGFLLNAYSAPAAEVGGDYYNFHWASGNNIGVLIADVSGKGMKAALVASALASAFRVQTWGNHNVANVLGRVNDFVRYALRPGVFITCSYGILDTNARRFTWARAGHEPMALAHSDGTVQWRAPAGMALGVLGSADLLDVLEVDSFTMKSGDELLLFTDGLTEAMNDDGEEFGIERIEAVLGHHARLHRIAASSLTQKYVRAVKRHARGAPPHDDLTFLSVACR